MQYSANFNGCKNDNFHLKTICVFLGFHMDCRYRLEPKLYYIKVGCKGVYITRVCCHDDLLVIVCHNLLFT